MFMSLFLQTGPAGGGWTVYPPLSALPQAIKGSGTGMTLWLGRDGLVHRELTAGWYQLHHYGN